MMKNIERHKRNVDILINMMTDDMPIHAFVAFRHISYFEIDRSKRVARKKATFYW